METNNNKDENPKGSWFERNAWYIALFVALFIFRMCSQMS